MHMELRFFYSAGAISRKPRNYDVRTLNFAVRPFDWGF